MQTGATTPNIVAPTMLGVVARVLAVVCGPYNVGRTVQTDPTLLRYASAITEQKKCWELLAESLTGFKLCATTCNRVCKRTQHVTSNNVGSCWPTMLRPFARGLTSLCGYITMES